MNDNQKTPVHDVLDQAIEKAKARYVALQTAGRELDSAELSELAKLASYFGRTDSLLEDCEILNEWKDVQATAATIHAATKANDFAKRQAELLAEYQAKRKQLDADFDQRTKELQAAPETEAENRARAAAQRLRYLEPEVRRIFARADRSTAHALL